MGQIKNRQSRDTGKYWVQFTEERRAKQKTQKNKKMSNTDAINKPEGAPRCLRKVRVHILFLMVL